MVDLGGGEPASQRTSAPEKVAATIVRAVEARRPRRRYPASGEVRTFRLLSHLPTRLQQAMIARTFGLSTIEASA